MVVPTSCGGQEGLYLSLFAVWFPLGAMSGFFGIMEGCGTMGCQGVMQGKEFRKENAGKKQKNECLTTFFFVAK